VAKQGEFQVLIRSRGERKDWAGPEFSPHALRHCFVSSGVEAGVHPYALSLLVNHRISGMAFTDDQTRAAIRTVKALYDYEIDPHGAIGWLAAQKWRAGHPSSATVTLETAHPAKFLDVMEAELGANCLEIPERLAILAEREKVATLLPADKAVFRDWLLQ